MAEINKHKPSRSLSRYRNVCGDCFDLEVLPDALNREIRVEVDDETVEIPYPFKADRKKVRAKMIIAALDIEENKQAAGLSVYARIYAWNRRGDALA